MWTQDFDVLTAGGGAQLTDRAHFLEGLKRGHNLSMWTPQSEISVDEVSQDTLVLASNPCFLSANVFHMLKSRGVDYIWFFHDYAPACKYRLFYPMRTTCKSCYLKERWLPVFIASEMIIWLSPLQRESWLWLYPELESTPYYLSPSPVDVDSFFDMGLPRQGVIVVEGLHPFKGRAHILRWIEGNPGVKVTAVGADPTVASGLPPNVEVINYVPYGQMNELYNRHEALLHLPQSPSPFDRTTVEAYLAGCRIIGNINIGALSYPWFKSREEVRDHIKNSSKEFWEQVEATMSTKGVSS